MAPQTALPGSASRPPWIVWLGLAVVLAAAAILSFDALRGLAAAVSIPGNLAWLLPVAVDAGAAVSCATWLGGRTAPDAARFAGRMTWSLLATTVAGNAGQLGMHAHGITPPWEVAVAVGSIPPAIVGATVHLVVLLVRRSGPVRTGVDDLGPVVPDCELEEWSDPWDRWSEEVVRESQTAGPDHSDHSDREPGPAADHSGTAETAPAGPGETAPTRTTPGPGPDLRSVGETAGPDHLLGEAVRWAADHPGPITQRMVRSRFNVGRDRAVSILEHINRTRGTA